MAASAKGKNTCHPIAIGEQTRTKMRKWKKSKRGKLENNVNVVFNSNKDQHLFDKLDEMG